MRKTNRITILIILPLFLFQGNCFGQKIERESVYKVNRKLEIPFTLGLFGVSMLGFDYLAGKEGVSYEKAITLSPDDVWWFDRPATKQDASKRLHAHHVSDVLLNSTVALPALLFLIFIKTRVSRVL